MFGQSPLITREILLKSSSFASKIWSSCSICTAHRLSSLLALSSSWLSPNCSISLEMLSHSWYYNDTKCDNDVPGETEEEFSSRLAHNLENLILTEGPETVMSQNLLNVQIFGIFKLSLTFWHFLLPDCCLYCRTRHGSGWCDTSSCNLFW